MTPGNDSPGGTNLKRGPALQAISMNRLTGTCVALAAAGLTACSTPLPPVAPPGEAAANRPGLPAPAPAPGGVAPLTLEGYKLAVARSIARVSLDSYDDPPPEVLKSIVVLEVTIDRNGNLERVAVRRSNGIRALENIAINSVRRAAPFETPAVSQRNRDGSVTFLESFLFRSDDRFRLLSLVR